MMMMRDGSFFHKFCQIVDVSLWKKPPHSCVELTVLMIRRRRKGKNVLYFLWMYFLCYIYMCDEEMIKKEKLQRRPRSPAAVLTSTSTDDQLSTTPPLVIHKGFDSVMFKVWRNWVRWIETTTSSRWSCGRSGSRRAIHRSRGVRCMKIFSSAHVFDPSRSFLASDSWWHPYSVRVSTSPVPWFSILSIFLIVRRFRTYPSTWTDDSKDYVHDNYQDSARTYLSSCRTWSLELEAKTLSSLAPRLRFSSLAYADCYDRDLWKLCKVTVRTNWWQFVLCKIQEPDTIFWSPNQLDAFLPYSWTMSWHTDLPHHVSYSVCRMFLVLIWSYTPVPVRWIFSRLRKPNEKSPDGFALSPLTCHTSLHIVDLEIPPVLHPSVR